MGPLPNLIYYASVCSSSTHTIAEYLDGDGDGDLPHMASKCLQLLPPHHSRFSHTANQRMFACIIEQPLLYCAIADEALSRSQVMSFLEQVKHEFASYAYAAGILAGISRLEARSLDIAFNPIFRRLVEPFVGIPQREEDNTVNEVSDKRMHVDAEADVEAGLRNGYYDSYNQASPWPPYFDSYSQASPCVNVSLGSRLPSTPLISKTGSGKYKQKKHKDETRDVSEKVEDSKGKLLDKTHWVEVSRDVSNPMGQLQRLSSSKSFKGQQMVRSMWWRRVKIVVLLDLVLCMILFGVWLGVCKGFSCTKEDDSS